MKSIRGYYFNSLIIIGLFDFYVVSTSKYSNFKPFFSKTREQMLAMRFNSTLYVRNPPCTNHCNPHPTLALHPALTSSDKMSLWCVESFSEALSHTMLFCKLQFSIWQLSPMATFGPIWLLVILTPLPM